MPQAMGITARPRKRRLVSWYTRFDVRASAAEKARIATVCQTVMSATHRRSCHTTNAGPRPGSASGFVPAPWSRVATASLIALQPVVRRQTAVTTMVPTARITYWR